MFFENYPFLTLRPGEIHDHLVLCGFVVEFIGLWFDFLDQLTVYIINVQIIASVFEGRNGFDSFAKGS
jgi:hypothetical protein